MVLKKLHKKTNVEKLKKMPTCNESKFYRSLGDPCDNSFDTVFQCEIMQDVKSDDFKISLAISDFTCFCWSRLVSPRSYIVTLIPTLSNFGKGMQNDINMYVTRDRLSNGNFRHKLDPFARISLGAKIPSSLFLKKCLHLMLKTL